MSDPFLLIQSTRRALDDLDQLAGIPAPADLALLLDRIDEFLQINNSTATAQIAAGVRAGAEPQTLWDPLAFAAATTTPGSVLTVRREVLALLVPEVRELAARAGREAYGKLIKKFNAAAAKMVAAVKIAAPDITAEEAVRADEPVRKAFTERADLLDSLNALSTALRVAAEMTGARVNHDIIASLVVDFDKVTPDQNRLVWSHVENGRIDWPALALLDVLGARPLGAPVASRHPGLVEHWKPNKFGHGRHLWDPVAEQYVGA